MVTVCTCGFDRYWKRKILASVPDRPTRIVDQACGTGILTLALSGKFPGCRVTGVELRDEYLDIAREKARLAGIPTIEFITGRAEEVMVEGGIDCITSSYLAKYADLEPLIANTGRMLRPGGMLIMHDFTYPTQPFRSIWHIWFWFLRRFGSRIYPEWQPVFDELPPFLRQTTWLSETLALLPHHGFCDISSRSLTFGVAAMVTARKAPSRVR